MKQKAFLLLSLLMFASPILAQKKIVTNADLEKYRQKRVSAEADYDKKAKEQGLPSRKELERRETMRQEGLREFAERAEIKRANAEDYWQSQTVDLIGEIAQINAEINYVQSRINQIPARQFYYSTGFLPSGFYGNNFGNGAIYNNENYNRTRIGGNIVFGNRNRTRVGIGINSDNSTRRGNSRFTTSARFPNINRRENFRYNNYYQNGFAVAPYAFSGYDDFTREDLLAQLSSLQQARAGLLARFSLIQDAAHRDGVRID